MKAIEKWYLTVDQIQKKTSVDKDVIRRHIKLGKLKTFQFHGTHLISKEEYEHWKKKENITKRMN